MTNKWRNIAVTVAAILVVGVGVGCAPSAPTPPPALPEEQHFLGGGTAHLRPNDAEGNDIRMDIRGTVYGKFTNNVPYTVEMYVVPEPPEATKYSEIHEMFANNIYSHSGVNEEFSFRLPPGKAYIIWFYNPTSNVDFEVEYELYWKPD